VVDIWKRSTLFDCGISAVAVQKASVEPEKAGIEKSVLDP